MDAARTSIYVHTNYSTREPPPQLTGLRIRRGWYPDEVPGGRVTVETMQTRLADAQRARGIRRAWNLLQVYKYEWLLSRLVADRVEGIGDLDEPWILADTDTIFVCGAAELNRRFRQFGTDLVISAESGLEMEPLPPRSSPGLAVTAHRRAASIPIPQEAAPRDTQSTAVVHRRRRYVHILDADAAPIAT